MIFVCLGSTPGSEVDLLMDRPGAENTNDDVELARKEKKHRRRRRVLYNLFDFLAIVMSKQRRRELREDKQTSFSFI